MERDGSGAEGRFDAETLLGGEAPEAFALMVREVEGRERPSDSSAAEAPVFEIGDRFAIAVRLSKAVERDMEAEAVVFRGLLTMLSFKGTAAAGCDVVRLEGEFGPETQPGDYTLYAVRLDGAVVFSDMVSTAPTLFRVRPSLRTVSFAGASAERIDPVLALPAPQAEVDAATFAAPREEDRVGEPAGASSAMRGLRRFFSGVRTG